MNIDWKYPFELAFEVSLWAIGWLLVAVVCFMAFAIFLSLTKGVITFFKKTEETTIKAKTKLRSVKPE